MDSLIAVLGVLVTNLPGLVAEVVLLTLAIVRWRQHPRVSMLATTGASLLLLNTLLASLFALLPLKLHDHGLAVTDIGMLLGVFGLARSVLYAVGIGLLVGAVFVERGAPSRAS